MKETALDAYELELDAHLVELYRAIVLSAEIGGALEKARINADALGKRDEYEFALKSALRYAKKLEYSVEKVLKIEGVE